MGCSGCGGGGVKPIIERDKPPVLTFDGTMKEFIVSQGWVYESESCSCMDALLIYSHPTLTTETGYKLMLNRSENNLRIINKDKYVKASLGTVNYLDGYNTVFNNSLHI